MKLHTNQELFNLKLEKLSKETGTSKGVLERDYWLYCLLSRFSQNSLKERLVIKGGAALKFFHNLIDREIYDLDFVVKDKVNSLDVRFMFDDLLLDCHYSTDENHVLQHVRWSPYVKNNISEEIRMDYYVGEVVFEFVEANFNSKTVNALYDDDVENKYRKCDFKLLVMGINNQLLEKILVTSDNYNRKRYDDSKKHFEDCLNIIKQNDFDIIKIMEIFKQKIKHDLELFDHTRINKNLSFEVFYLSDYMPKEIYKSIEYRKLMEIVVSLKYQ